MTTNGSANGSANCYNFTKMEVEAAYFTKISVATLGILLSFVVVALLCISKNKVIKLFVFRLVLYLMLSNLAEATFLLLEVIPVEVQDGKVFTRPGPHWSHACSAFGFLDQIASWMGFAAIVWIMIYMLWRTYHLYKIQDGEQQEDIPKPKVSKKVKIIGILTLLIAPFVLNWLPFMQELYGQSGPWCWIKTTQSTCDIIEFGVALTLVLFFVPVFGVVAFGFISLTIICICGCKAALKLSGGNKKKADRFIGEILLIVVYPLIYIILCIVLLANRIKEATISNKEEPPFFPLWMTVAIADPARVALLPLAFILHPKSWMNMFCKEENCDFMDDEEFVVPPEGDDIEKPNTIRQSFKINQPFAYGALLQPETYDEA